MKIDSHPILSCPAAVEYEKAYFSCHNENEEVVMYRAGRAVASAIEEDFEEISGFPYEPKILVLAGKGHNTGDAFICANSLLDRHPDAKVLTLLAFSPKDFRPNVKAPFELLKVRSEIVEVKEETNLDELLSKFAAKDCIDLCIDGVFGMNARPPLRNNPLRIITAANKWNSIRLRAAIDLPSGVGEESDPNAFHADFTYATGIAKLPILDTNLLDKVGRIRYLDLGFFNVCTHLKTPTRILKHTLLWQLARLRKSQTHKRNFGHLLVLAGSKSMPGACLMSSMAAINSGVGLVTVATVTSAASAGIQMMPECMWSVAEADSEHLTLESLHQLEDRLEDFSAILAGPGIGRSVGARDLIRKLVETVNQPIVLDADALFAGIHESLEKRPDTFAPIILTPHEGEWNRICEALPQSQKAGDDHIRMSGFCRNHRVVLLLKGPRTRIFTDEQIYLSPYGGPVLARGGTGDLLAGLTGSILAQQPKDSAQSANLAAVWHGRAADCLARQHGTWAVRTTQLIDYLPVALGFRD